MAGKKFKPLLTVLSLITVLALCIIQPVAAFDVSENSDEQEKIRQENSQYQEEIKEKKKSISEKEKYSEELQQQILDLSTQITESTETIKTLNAGIIEKQAQIDEKTQAVADRLDLLRTRLRAVYMAGDVSSLEIILQAKDFSDFIDKMELVRSMSTYDDNLINKLQEEMEGISKEQKQLRKDKKQVEEEKKKLEETKKLINELSEQNSSMIKELKKDKTKAEDAIKANEERQKQLEKALEKYNKELAKKLAAQRKKAEEEMKKEQKKEEARKAAEEARKKRLADRTNEPDQIIVEANGEYVWPCPGHTNLTSTFDEWRGVNNHGALDIADGSVYGAAVVACWDGIVFSTCTECTHDYGKFSSCGCGGGYGNYVMIDHGDGKISIYGHLSGVTVEPGQQVVAGQLIGYVGSTGYSTGPHLHFEMRYNGVQYDPMTEYTGGGSGSEADTDYDSEADADNDSETDSDTDSDDNDDSDEQEE